MSKPRILSPRMLEALVTVAKGPNYLDNFRNATVLGLEKREYIKMDTEKGYVLTLSGQMYLIRNGHMVMDGYDTIIHVTTGYISVLRKVKMVREYHIRKALSAYNHSYIMLTGKPGVGTVDDMSNNVGRRCNIKLSDDYELRCYEILAQVVFYSTPEIENQYLLRYVGTEKLDKLNESDFGPYCIESADRLTNLY